MTTFQKLVNQEKVDMTFYIANVASSCLYRDMEVRFFDQETQSFIDISDILAEELGMKVKNGCVRVHGVGMNMAFALSQQIVKQASEKYGKKIEIKDHIFIKSERDLYVNFIQRFLKEKKSL